MKKILILTLLMLMAASLGGGKAYLDYRLRTELDTRTHAAAHYVTVSYQQVNTTLTGAINLSEVQLTKLPIRIATLTLHQAYQFYDATTLPQTVHVTAHQLTIPVSDRATVPPLLTLFGYAPYYVTPKELRDLGYTTITAEVDITLTKVADKEMLGVIAAVMPTVGQLQVTFSAKNVLPPAQWPLAATSVELTALEIRYTDSGLVKQVGNKLAQRQQVTVENLVQTFGTKLQTDTTRLGVKLEASTFTQLQKFLQTPSTLVIRCKPSTPLTVAALTRLSPVTFVERLGFSLQSLDN